MLAGDSDRLGVLRIGSMQRLLSVPHLNIFFILGGYLAVGNYFYTWAETKTTGCPAVEPPAGSYYDEPATEAASCAWSQTDALYFQMVTMSTVGYGDLTPSGFASRLFTLFYILFGIVVVFTGLASLMSTIFAPFAAVLRAWIEVAFPSKYHSGDRPGPAWLYYAKGLLPELLVVVLVQVVAAEGAAPSALCRSPKTREDSCCTLYSTGVAHTRLHTSPLLTR